LYSKRYALQFNSLTGHPPGLGGQKRDQRPLLTNQRGRGEPAPAPFLFRKKLPGSCCSNVLLQNLFKLGKKHVIARLVGYIVDVDVADRALPVHDEDGPLGEALAAQHAVLLRNCAKGIEIAQQREGDAAKIFCPCREAGHMVDADAQDLGIESCEADKLCFVGRYLVGSDGRPGKGKKRQHHIFASKPAEPHFGVEVTFQTKVRGLLP